MKWSDERYVRVYCRNTPDMIAVGWEARSLLWELLRAANRAGEVALGRHGARGLSAVLHVPLDVVERNLPVLLEDGCIRLSEDGTVLGFPNFVDAQESVKSAARRKAEQRERERMSRAEDIGPAQLPSALSRAALPPANGVTEAHAAVTHRHVDVTDRGVSHAGVTDSHEKSRGVTPCRAVPSVPYRAVPPAGAHEAGESREGAEVTGCQDPSPRPESRQVRGRHAFDDDGVGLTDARRGRVAALSAGETLDADEQWARCRAWYEREGKLVASEDAAWETWIRDAVKYAKRDRVNARDRSGGSRSPSEHSGPRTRFREEDLAPMVGGKILTLDERTARPAGDPRPLWATKGGPR